MSDDAPRSAQGNRPDQRRGRGAPTWWDMLQRSDLPDDPRAGDRTVETVGWQAHEQLLTGHARRSRAGTVLSLVAAVLVALAVAVAVWVATGAVGHSVPGTAAVIVGVPVAMLVASLLASLAGRRRRR